MADDDTTTDDTTGDDDDASGGDDDGSTDDGKTFTQDQVDRIVADRLRRDRRSRQDDDEKVAEWRAKAEKLDELEAADQTELERSRARVKELETQLDAERVQRERRAVEDAVTKAAQDANAVSVPAVVALALRGDHGLKAGDDGTVEGATELVAGLVENDEYSGLFGRKSNGAGSGDGGTRSGSGDSPHPFDADMAQIMDREGLKSI